MKPLTLDELEAISDALGEILAGPDNRDIPHEVYDRALDKIADELAYFGRHGRPVPEHGSGP